MNFLLYLVFLISSSIFEVISDDVNFQFAYGNLRGREFYFFVDTFYTTKEEMLLKIALLFPTYIGKEITLNAIGVTNGKILTKYKVPELIKACVPNPNQPKSPINMHPVKNVDNSVVIDYANNGKVLYKCDGRTVPSLKLLATCALKKRSLRFGQNCVKTFRKDETLDITDGKNLNEILQKKKICRKPDTINMELQEKVKEKSYSNKVWKSIWPDKHSFPFFSQSNYRLLKERFLRELNQYRSVKKLSLFQDSYEHSKIAQQYAMEFATMAKFVTKMVSGCEVIVNVTPIPFSPLLIKTYYDDKYKKRSFPGEKLKANGKIDGTKLFSKKATNIGIGIKNKNCDLAIIFLLCFKH